LFENKTFASDGVRKKAEEILFRSKRHTEQHAFSHLHAAIKDSKMANLEPIMLNKPTPKKALPVLARIDPINSSCVMK
jgi:hypothetical protein